MKQIALLSVLTLLALPEMLSANTSIASMRQMRETNQYSVSPDQCVKECNPTRWTLQARGAAFIPLKQQLRDIYGSALPTVQLESSYAIYNDLGSGCDQLLLWENVGWTSKSGTLPGWGYDTKLQLFPISMGLTYQFNLARNIDFYLGAGPTYSFLRMKIDYPFGDVRIKKNQFGFTTKTGFRFTFATNFFFDIFGDYYFTEFSKINNFVPTINRVFNGFFVGGGFGGKW